MKKFFLLSFIFLLLPLISAVEFNVNQNFSQGETIIAKISGNFLTPISNQNVFFYEGHVRIPLEYSVSKIGEDYYLYALTSGKAPSNYSISIQNIQYMRGSEVASDNLAANFSITNNTADFSVNPGFVTTAGDFYLQIQNLQDKELNVGINTQSNTSKAREILVSQDMSSSSSVSLRSGEIKKINFQLGSGESGLRMVELTTGNLTYKVPVYIFSSSAGNFASLEIDPQFLTLSSSTNASSKTSIYISNSGDKALQNISLSLSDSLVPYIIISQSSIANLSANTGVQIDLSYSSSTEKKVEGILKLKSGNTSASSFISLTFTKNYTASKTNASVITKTCAEISGNICASDEECDKDPIYAKDNVCCLGTCKKTVSSSSGVIIGIIIIGVIAGALFLLYKKYKKAKKPVDLLEIAKGKPKL
ncbi:Uncharacterised protein [uncultured archaeon]|nr:Uncharacterised protein [uncultured archaeon]